eukprot:Skav208401  [mRNA]  locus=scaffold1179:161621:173399:- [translate_table: standard]
MMARQGTEEQLGKTSQSPELNQTSACRNALLKSNFACGLGQQDADAQPCSSAEEFTHSATGQTEQLDYECAMNRACTVEVSGLLMAVWVPSGQASAWISAGALQLRGHRCFARDRWLSRLRQRLSARGAVRATLISFTVPGDRQLCYCSTYDADSRQRCGEQVVEFIQSLGLLTIRGPSYRVISCAANRPCNITAARMQAESGRGTSDANFPQFVSGVRLAIDDQLQVCPLSSGCGNTTACSPAGPDALGGLLSPHAATATQTSFGRGPQGIVRKNAELVVPPPSFREPVASLLQALGSLPVGTYLLCYCAPGTSSTAPISCSSPEDLDVQAGQLRIRGVDRGQLFECVENILCQFTVTGFDLSVTDMVMAVPLDGECGVADGDFAVGAFNPNSRSRAIVNAGSSAARQFEYDSITAPERYKICYCVFDQCINASHFSEEVGTLVVKGIERSRFALTCELRFLLAFLVVVWSCGYLAKHSEHSKQSAVLSLWPWRRVGRLVRGVMDVLAPLPCDGCGASGLAQHAGRLTKQDLHRML